MSDFCLQCGKLQSLGEFSHFNLNQNFGKLKYKSSGRRFMCGISVEKMIGFHFKDVIISPNRSAYDLLKKGFKSIKLITGTS